MDPAHSQRQAHTLGRFGALLLDAGLSVTDVRHSLVSIASTAAPEADWAFSVLPALVIINSNATGRAIIINAEGTDLSFRQAAHASRLARAAEQGRVPLEQLDRQIDAVRSRRQRHPALGHVLGSAIISIGLAVLFRCPWWAVLAALVTGALVGVISWGLGRLRGATAVVPFATAFVSTWLVGTLADAFNLGPVPLFAVCAPVAVLVPGALITNALLELTATDIITGAGRLAYGLIMLASMTAGVAAGAQLTGLRIDGGSAALVGEAASVTGQAAGLTGLPPLWMSWAGVVLLALGVGAAFGSSLRLTALSVVVMTCTYTVVVLLSGPFGTIVATGCAAAALFIAATVIQHLAAAVPATVSFQPAFLLLVPGTIGLVALTSQDALAAAPATFLSLCIGTKAGSVLADAFRRRPRGRPLHT